MTYQDIARRLAALEQQAQEDTEAVDHLAPRYIDYRKAIDPNASQSWPIIIRWVEHAAPLGDETAVPLIERTVAENPAQRSVPAVAAS